MQNHSSKRFLLVYGSQTGQSKAISEEIVERCHRIGINADIHCFGRIEKEVSFAFFYGNARGKQIVSYILLFISLIFKIAWKYL